MSIDKLKEMLLQRSNISEESANKNLKFFYKENKKRLGGWIDTVFVLAAIDINKTDIIYICLATQTSERSEIKFKGFFCFENGENDDPARVLLRFRTTLSNMHPVFSEF